MKKLFLSAVAAILSVTAFSQQVNIHVTGANVKTHDRSGKILENYNRSLNTKYMIDLSNNTMRWVCPSHASDEVLSIQSRVKDSIITITYQAEGVYDQNFSVPVTFKINLKSNTITWSRRDTDTTTVYTFNQFTLNQTNVQ